MHDVEWWPISFEKHAGHKMWVLPSHISLKMKVPDL